MAPRKTTASPTETTDVARAKYTRVTGKARVQLIAAVKREYKSGKSITDTAKTVGMSYGFVQRALAEAGVKTRTRGGSKPKK